MFRCAGQAGGGPLMSNVRRLMRKTIRVVAVAMWWLSFVLPIGASEEGRSILGGQAFVATTIMLFGFLPFSLLLVIPPASWLSNFLPLRETFRLLRNSDEPPALQLAGGAFFINLVSFMFFLREVVAKATPFYKYPAIYIWLCSFLLLWLSTLWVKPQQLQ
jgi:hypothetical protein